MSEPHITETLLPFHLGAVDDAERATIEAHLQSCAGCLGAFFELKRRVESAAAIEERPSDLVRKRLRNSVARRLPVTPERRLRLAVGAAVVAAIIIGVVVTARRPEVSPQTSHPVFIDVGKEPQAQSAL